MSKIEFEAIDADNVENLMIKLYAPAFESYSKSMRNQVNLFISALCELIGAKTDIDYHAYNASNNGVTYIELINYNEKFKDTYELVNKRVNTLVHYLESLDLTKQQAYLVKISNLLMFNKINLNTLLSVSVVNMTTKENYIEPIPIHIKQPLDFKRIGVKRVVTTDNSTITLITDKCSTTYALYVNLTVPFNEMSMSYNALHLYEHLMMRCFKGLPQDKLLESNGCTFPNGLCHVYTVHSTVDSLKQYLNLTIKTLFEARDDDYWEQEQQVKDIELETKRTISETRYSRSLTDFGRSDLHAYNNGYDKNIFKYWSNKPFDIIVVGPAFTDTFINVDSVNAWCKKHPLHNIKRPAAVKYKIIPISVLRSKENDNTFIQKASTKEIKKLFMNPAKKEEIDIRTLLPKSKTDFGPYGYLYGLDCKMLSLNDSLSRHNTVLTPMVFINKLFTDEELELMLNSSNISTNALHYNSHSFFF